MFPRISERSPLVQMASWRAEKGAAVFFLLHLQIFKVKKLQSSVSEKQVRTEEGAQLLAQAVDTREERLKQARRLRKRNWARLQSSS